MKYVLALVLACLVVAAAPAYAQETAKPDAKPAAVDVTGVWDMVVESPQGAMDIVGTFKQEGEKLTGTQASQMGEVALEGTVVDNEIKYVINIDMGGQQMTITFAGKVDGDTMAGVFEFGGMGSAGWSAKRRKQ
jgi:curli biogenesis system outer membrane secretion channel CsgG